MTQKMGERVRRLAASGLVQEPDLTWINFLSPKTPLDIAERIWLAACVEALDRWSMGAGLGDRVWTPGYRGDGAMAVVIYDEHDREPTSHYGLTRLESLVAALEAIHDAS